MQAAQCLITLYRQRLMPALCLKRVHIPRKRILQRFRTECYLLKAQCSLPKIIETHYRLPIIPYIRLNIIPTRIARSAQQTMYIMPLILISFILLILKPRQQYIQLRHQCLLQRIIICQRPLLRQQCEAVLRTLLRLPHLHLRGLLHTTAPHTQKANCNK